MLENFIFRQNPLLFVGLILVVLVLSMELAYRYGSRLVGDPRMKDEAWNTVYAGLLVLVAFMLGLSYAQAQERFDARRQLVIKEANAIGTTWLRADQLPQPQSNEFRALLKSYASLRLHAYQNPRDLNALNRAVEESEAQQGQLWRLTSDALRAHPADQGLALLMQTLNDAIDVSAEQIAALTQHVPVSLVMATLLLVVLATAATGFSFARLQARPAVFTAIYIIALTVSIGMIVDLDRPQSGFVRVSLDPLRAEIAQMHSP